MKNHSANENEVTCSTSIVQEKKITGVRVEQYGYYIDLVDEVASVSVDRLATGIILDEGAGSDRIQSTALPRRSSPHFELWDDRIVILADGNYRHVAGRLNPDVCIEDVNAWIDAVNQLFIEDSYESADGTKMQSASDFPESTFGDSAPAEDEKLVAPSVVRGKIDRFGVAMGTGRRKTAVARVRVKDGCGEFVVNGKPFTDFFCVERDRKMVQEVLDVTETRDKVDVWVRVNGGGTTGQAGAVILGVARALQVKDPSLHHVLATGGFLTRDDRMVERKKYGRRKARRGFQFSKR